MFKQFLSLMLVALMINTIGLQFAFANSVEVFLLNAGEFE